MPIQLTTSASIFNSGAKTTDHRHARDRYTGPSRVQTEAVVDGHMTAHYSDSHRLGATPADYVAELSNGISKYLSSPEWREAADESISCEFRPVRTQPTPQQIIIAKDRTVTFDPRPSIHDGSPVTVGEAIAGTFAFTEACERVALFSQRFTVLDAHSIGGFSESALEQTAVKYLRDFQTSCNTTVAKAIGSSANLTKVSVAKPTGAPREIAEDLIDILAANIDTSFGQSLSDFTFMLPLSLSPILDRAAQRAGLEDVSELIGAGIQYHNGPEKILIIPNGFAALSFREGSDGDIWKVTVSRAPGVLGYDVELSGVADVMANALVKLTLANPEDPTEKLQTEVVAMPIITEITLT